MTDKKVIFTYVSKENRKFLEELAESSNQTLSHCVDRIIDQARAKKSIKIEKFEPKYVRQAKAWYKRHPHLAV